MNLNSSILENLWEKGCSFLNTRYSILCGAMTWVSNYSLVSSVSNAGGFGVLACGSMNCEQLLLEINKTKEKTSNSFGVNLITMHPDLDKLIDTVGQSKVRYAILAGGLPKKESINKLKDYNCKVISFAPSLIVAKRLIKSGVDALIIEGHEAGGHIGPIVTSVLAQEILPFVDDVPIFVAGGIGRGENVVSYLQMGAAGCQLGTHFVCANESPAHPNFKKAFIRAQSRDAVLTKQVDDRFPVIPVRAIKNEATKKFTQLQSETIKRYEKGEVSLNEARLLIEKFWVGSLRRAVVDGDVENGSLMAGQSVGMVNKEEPVSDIMHRIIEQANLFIDKTKPYF
ncbi:MAG: NAD(P)H-dependent flavin oxidoreductase [Alphaproteobacteria bacterium]